MNIQSKLLEVATICALGGALVGCDAPLDRDVSEEDRVVPAAAVAAVSIIAGVLSGASSIKNLLDGGEGGPTVADLSSTALQEIREVVTDVNVDFGFEQYINDLDALIDVLETYNEPTCTPATEGGCAAEYLNASSQLFELAGRASDVWSSFDSDQELHAANRMAGAFSMVSIAGIRTKILVERARIDTKRGENGTESWDTACDEAADYLERLKRLEDEEFDAYVESLFGQVYTKRTGSELGSDESGGYNIVTFISCFKGPNGEQCADDSEVTLHCKGEVLDYCMNWSMVDEQAVQDAPYSKTLHVIEEARTNARDAHYTSLRPTILGGDEFDRVLAELERISGCEERPDPDADPDPDPDPGPGPACDKVSLSDAAYPDKTTGVYEATGEEYNGEPVYKMGDYSIYKRVSKAAANNWVLDDDGVDEEWSGTLDHTTNSPATPGEGVWKTGGKAVCQ